MCLVPACRPRAACPWLIRRSPPLLGYTSLSITQRTSTQILKFNLGCWVAVETMTVIQSLKNNHIFLVFKLHCPKIADQYSLRSSWQSDGFKNLKRWILGPRVHLDLVRDIKSFSSFILLRVSARHKLYHCKFQVSDATDFCSIVDSKLKIEI